MPAFIKSTVSFVTTLIPLLFVSATSGVMSNPALLMMVRNGACSASLISCTDFAVFHIALPAPIVMPCLVAALTAPIASSSFSLIVRYSVTVGA